MPQQEREMKWINRKRELTKNSTEREIRETPRTPVSKEEGKVSFHCGNKIQPLVRGVDFLSKPDGDYKGGLPKARVYQEEAMFRSG